MTKCLFSWVAGLCLFLSPMLLDAQCVLTTVSSPDGSNPIVTCEGDGNPDVVNFNNSGAAGSSYAYAITDANFNILQIVTESSFDFEGSGIGNCQVWGFSYDGDITGMAGDFVFSTQFSTNCWLISQNAIQVSRTSVQGGSISLTNGDTEAFACVGDGFPDVLSFTSTGDGTVSYVVTDGDGTIISIGNSPNIDFDGNGEGAFQVYAVSFTGNITAMVGDNINSVSFADDCFQVSENFVSVTGSTIDAGTITTDDGLGYVQIADSTDNQVFTLINTSTSNANYAYILTDNTFNILQILPNDIVDLSSFDAGKYFVWAYSYTGDIVAQVGDSVFSSPFASGCSEISITAVVIEKFFDGPGTGNPVCTADAGTLTIDANPVTLVDGNATISATPNGDAVVPADYETIFVLTSGGVLLQTGTAPSFDVTTAGDYVIHTLIAEVSDDMDANFLDLSGVVLGTTTAGDVLPAIMAVCADLDLDGAPVTVAEAPSCTADAGTLTIDANPVTLVDGNATISATPNGDAVVPADYETIFVLTSGGVLLQTGTAPSFDVTTAGDYVIHTLIAEVSDDMDANFLDLSGVVLGTTTAGDVLPAIMAVCADLDLDGAPVTVAEAPSCTADAGTLTIDANPVTLVDGNATISATPNGDAVVPADYETIFVLTSGGVLLQTGTAPSFDVTMAGDYVIHTLIAEVSDDMDANFLDLSGVVLGTTTAGDVLPAIMAVCADLDLDGAPVTVAEAPSCTADAGTLTIDANPVTLVDGNATISATPNGDAVVPADYETIFVLTSGGVLLQTGTAPSFDVTTAGDYVIHTLIAEVSDDMDANFLDLSGVVLGTTTAGDVLPAIMAVCADLDLDGAPVTVAEAPSCTADAGTLTIDANPVTLVDGNATISATPNGDAVVPADYETIFVLTSGGVLLQTGTAPSFDVTTAGDYVIHTLIAEVSDDMDANFLDLSGVVLGTTTAGDVLPAIMAVCADLDLDGAPVTVAEAPSCTADAGTLTIDANPVTLVDGNATISATPNGDAVVPADYETIFVLTSGGVLLQTGTAPSFDVTTAGDYVIHTLIAEVSDDMDANFLDLSGVVLGTTTAGDVLPAIMAVCADLDLDGAPVTVAEAPSCTADAGTLTIDANPVTLVDGNATISATPNGDAVVPADYETIFVLTSGGVLLQTGTAPSFDVTTAGDYVIHTLIAEVSDDMDANFLDLSGVVLGTTTAGDVLPAIMAVCADLDLDGAPVTVAEAPSCTADAGTLTIDANPVTLVDGNATISATPNGDAVVPADYETIFVLTSGGVLLQTGTAPSFDVTTAGDYVIHTLIAEVSDDMDANFLDLSGVVLGTTTAGDVLPAIMAVCADLDLDGAPVTVIDDMMNPCDDFDGGMVMMPNGNTVRYTCPGDGNADIVMLDSMGVMGENFTYIVTDGMGMVLGIPMGDMVNVEGAGSGNCRIYGVAYSGNLIIEVGGDINSDLSDDCFDLSDNFVLTIREVPEGGSVTTASGATEITICSAGDGTPDVIEFAATDTIGQNFTYVVTDNQGMVLGIPPSNSVDFDPAGTGACYVYGLSYTGDLTLAVGDVLSPPNNNPNANGGNLSPVYNELYGGISGIYLGEGDDLSQIFVSSNTQNKVGVFGVNGDDTFTLDTFDVEGLDADGIYYDVDADVVYLLNRTDNVINAYSDVNAAITGGTDPMLTATSTSDFTNGREIAVSGDMLVVAQDADMSNGDQNRLLVYQITPTEITLMNEYDVDINLWGIHVEGSTLYAVVDNSNNVAVFEDFFGQADGMISPTNTISVEGIVRTHGLTYDANEDLMVLTDVGSGAVADDGAFVVVYNFTDAIADGNISAAEQVRVEGADTFLGNPVDVALDIDNDRVYITERANGGGRILSFELPNQNEGTGSNIDVATDCFDFSDEFVVVNRFNIDGGIVTITGGATDSTIVIDGNPNIITFETTVDTVGQDFDFTFVVTDESGIILGVPMTNSVDFNPAGLGVCYVWGLSYTGNITATVGDDATAVALTDGCFDLSDMFVTITRIENSPNLNPSPNNPNLSTADAALVKFSVYPNPASDNLSLVWEQSENAVSTEVTINLVDLQGRVISSRQENVTTGQNIFQMEVLDLDGGLYTIVMSNKDGVKTQRFLKK